MPRIPLTWLAEHVELPAGANAESVAADLVTVGLEEEAIHPGQVTGPLVVGRVLDLVKEPQKNGKTITWCRVDVGDEHNEPEEHPKDPQPGEAAPSRGIVCGAHNFDAGDLVVVALPGTVLPGPFEIAARRTYGHVSDGMICSAAELELGTDHEGIIVLGEGAFTGLDTRPGDDAIALLGLGEEVVEINVTPDRGYCFAMRGVAREYSHATDAAFTDPVTQIDVPAATGEGVGVELDDTSPLRGQDGCTRYVAQRVTGVDAGAPSPRWLQQRLTLAGMRPISLIVDIANYVMLDLGQPLHTFDANAVHGPIVVRRARPGETLTTLDDQVRALDVEDLVIADSPAGDHGVRAVALAGVMGGAETEVSAATAEILLEGATFSPVSIARTARRHRLPSESSKRFERGVDPALPSVAVRYAAELIVRYGGGRIEDARTDVGSVPEPAPIDLPLDAPAALIGVEYSEGRVVGPLQLIGCAIERSDGVLHVTPPTWRPDLRGPADLIEEVARLDGYDRIPSVLPAAPGGRGLTPAQRRRRAVATALAEAGLTEVLSYPFTSTGVFDALRYPAEDPHRDAVALANPLSEAEPLLRTTLLQTLLPVARLNLGRGADDVAVFETGLISRARAGRPAAPVLAVDDRPSDADLATLHAAVPEQPRHVAGILGGRVAPANTWGTPRAYDWADAVDAARRVAASAGAEIELAAAEHAPWHPGRCAEIRLAGGEHAGDIVGYAGELHPGVVAYFGLPARTAAFELDLDAIIAAAPDVIAAEPLSTYPVAKEDFAFVVDRSVPSAAVEAAITVGIGDVLESAQLFDLYEGEQVGDGRKSLAFAVRLRSVDGTLSADDIAAARRRCIDTVSAAVGGVLRA